MPILAFDTSTPTGVVALLKPDGMVIERTGPSSAKHGDTLLPMIGEVLAEAAVEVTDLRLLAVGTGPGSFTGLRIGIATAQGLALARPLPVIGVSSLAVLARHAMAGAAPEGLTSAVLDAYRGEVYVALYGRDAAGQPVERLAPFSATPQSAAAQLLAAAGAQPFALLGNGLRKYADEFALALGPRLVPLPDSFDCICPTTLGQMAERLMAAGAATGGAELQPIYVRGADAKLPQVPLKL